MAVLYTASSWGHTRGTSTSASRTWEEVGRTDPINNTHGGWVGARAGGRAGRAAGARAGQHCSWHKLE